MVTRAAFRERGLELHGVSAFPYTFIFALIPKILQAHVLLYQYIGFQKIRRSTHRKLLDFYGSNLTMDYSYLGRPSCEVPLCLSLDYAGKSVDLTRLPPRS